ncbi:MAG: divergent polysaccharide deacetylase family protein, partial [Armatimonadetes bacterium]|nr:divergent polysaccharide deacetylase family protein [Armatimonadota bacterium]
KNKVFKKAKKEIFKTKTKDKIAFIPPKVIPALLPSKIAIIIDDFGDNFEIARKFLTFPEKITFSILPKRTYSRKIAYLALKSKKDIMLHLPMEPLAGNPGRGAIFTKMSEIEIKKILEEDLADFPGIKGVNNHEGSKATADKKIMREVIKIIKEHDLFFVDSLTSYTSVGEEIAKVEKLKFGKRDIFLDNEDNASYIEAQTLELIALAKKQGAAIGIGHARINTFSALIKMLSVFKEKNIKLVGAFSLVK